MYLFILIIRHFNPHFREGSDPTAFKTDCATLNFNPHFREGSDCPVHTFQDFKHISIHTSAKEVTPAVYFVTVMPGDFNPHFREGSDIFAISSEYIIFDFNPHFREGSDRYKGRTSGNCT